MNLAIVIATVMGLLVLAVVVHRAIDALIDRMPHVKKSNVWQTFWKIFAVWGLLFVAIVQIMKRTLE